MNAFSDRRPIHARGWAPTRALADALAARGVSPDAISLAGLAAALAAGTALALTAMVDAGWLVRAGWAAGGLLVLVRLAANLLDGMVAERGHGASPLGELLNEVPDRASDVAILMGLGLAAGGDPAWGLAAALAAVLAAYVRVAGKWLTGQHDFAGPFAKQQRMAVVIAVALAGAIAPAWTAGAFEVGLATVALALVTAGSLLTAGRRLARLRRTLMAGKVSPR